MINGNVMTDKENENSTTNESNNSSNNSNDSNAVQTTENEYNNSGIGMRTGVYADRCQDP
jgi:hypothetical protein